MAKFIDAEEALRMMKNSRQDCPYTTTKKLIWNLAHDSCISCIMATETADVVEVKRGKWGSHHPDGSATCSVCGRKQKDVWDFDNWQNYCGHCGADMRGDEK